MLLLVFDLLHIFYKTLLPGAYKRIHFVDLKNENGTQKMLWLAILIKTGGSFR